MTVAEEVPDNGRVRKARGAFFTPPAIADFVVEWAVRGAGERVLEPSCGEAAFLERSVHRLRSLGAESPTVSGVDIHAASVREAARIVTESGGKPDILEGDFFTVPPEPIYDAVVGNPPFIRYHDFSGEARLRSRQAALEAGVSISGLASSWAAFTVHAALFLKVGGRMGLVVPAELLSVNYAAHVRRFLLQSFSRVDLVLFTERVFPEVQEEVVLLLAEGFRQGNTDHANIYQAHNADDLGEVLASSTTWKPLDPADKWTPLLLSREALHVYTDLVASGAYVPLQNWGKTSLGMVTGNNKYFALSPQKAAELGIARNELVRLSPPGSRHLRGLGLSDYAMTEMGRRGSATYLFRPPGEPSEAAQRYIDAGETAGVNLAYKCRVRKPWWRVPLVKPADLLLTYMNADTPRITTNGAGALHLNSVHGIYLRSEHSSLGRELLPLASLTSMTLVGAETVGRAYGGGMLKIEPREADRLPVPSPALVAANRDALLAVRPQMATLLRNGRLTEAAKIVDEVLMVKSLGMRRNDVATLRDEFSRLSARRAARA
ncbi:hypothetical protein HMPREF0063_10197 [Aeromicrobium marinum DSM 15272]|uniref:Uncharacterized protein n=1 Tax=Aeromicrobium marinum DSM 15272 TaxID=585531 RepID=E2S840_9ACTN|nr:N-6 DNA methylase [Aeromicrobium marinum]EFQ84345.1 hypothetical protein HMPREF0063_10197 [Aeromicrobium marinum DSM 15272]